MDTERPMSKMQSLLHAIAKLYSSVVATVVHERVMSYHADTGADDDDDIGASLRDYINNVKKNATTAPSVSQSVVTEPVLPTATHGKGNTALLENPSAGALDSTLSDYFKKHTASSRLGTPLGEKLKTSAWNHTHSAIRFAHQGDFASAKLHAELANNAIHELGHYMPEDDFIAFKRAVKAELLDKA
jgi:hypothetical protein